MKTIKAWWKSSTGKDIPKGWDSSKEECLDFITRDSYATGFNKAKELYIKKALEWFGNYLMEIGYPDDWMRDSKVQSSGEQRFRKAMEE